MDLGEGVAAKVERLATSLSGVSSKMERGDEGGRRSLSLSLMVRPLSHRLSLSFPCYHTEMRQAKEGVGG